MQEDNRPLMPDDWANHIQNECVRVYSHEVEQNLTTVPDQVAVKLYKPVKGETAWRVYSLDKKLLGHLIPDMAQDAGLEIGKTYYAEIVRPCWRFKNSHEMYIPYTVEALEAKKRKKALTLWINLDYDKMLGDKSDRMDYYDARIIVNRMDGEKPIYGVIADERMLFQVTPRMKNYDEIAKRAKLPIRRIICELRVSDYGYYYRVGFYY